MSYAELMGFKKNFGFYDGPQGMPCNLTIITLPGAAVTITLGAESYTATAAADGRAQFTIGTAGAWSVIAATDDVTQVGTVIVENVVTKALALPAPLEDLTWTEIAAISRAGLAAQNFNIGDSKQILLSSGEVVIAEIIGFDHDDIADGSVATYGRTKAGITFQTRKVLNSPRRFSGSTVIWSGSEIRLTTLPSIAEMLPYDLQREIVQVKKYTANAFTAAAGSWEIETTIDQLFLLSRVEAINKSITHPGEGTQYEYYAAGRSLIKTDNGGTARPWWNRSPYNVSSLNGIMIITAAGAENYSGATSNANYIAFAFCV